MKPQQSSVVRRYAAWLVTGLLAAALMAWPAAAEESFNSARVMQHLALNEAQVVQQAQAAINDFSLIQIGVGLAVATEQTAIDGQVNSTRVGQSGVGNLYLGRQVGLGSSNAAVGIQSGAGNLLVQHQTARPGAPNADIVLQRGYGNVHLSVQPER